MPTKETGPAPCPSPKQQQQQQQHHQFDFQPTQKLRRPRAWERAPTSPFVAHPRGRKVWKRHGLLRNKASQHAHLSQQDEDEKETEEEGPVESPDKMIARPIKRLRINRKQAAVSADDGGLLHQKNPIERYITTLQDKGPETPKRKRALRKSLRPDGFLRKSERKKSHSLDSTTTVIEACRAVALEKDDQVLYTSTTTETDAAVSTLGDKGTPTRVETVLSANLDEYDHSFVPCAQTSPTANAVEDDQSKTTGPANGQAIERLYDQDRLTASEILSPNSPSISASATDYRPDELVRIADSNPSGARGGVLVLIEVPPLSSAEDKAGGYGPQCHTGLNDTKTVGIPDASSEQNEQMGKWTRSKPRFSDNTNLLMDFLSRAQAKKAAKDDQSNVSARMISSRPPPRAALADITLSPPQPSELTNHPGTSPLKQRLMGLDDDDDDEDDDDDQEDGAEGDDEDDDGHEGDEDDEKLEGAAIETGSCRRSTRTRFSRPAKTAEMTRIPVRRADGTEPRVLQRSKAQELATVTRANTRRNKGQAKPPKLRLKRIPAGDADEATIAPRRAEKDKAGAVRWDEKLVYYMDPSESQEGEAEKRPRVRRLRKLGAANGTPARKKVIMSNNSSNENGAPNRRSKSKGRGTK